MKGGCKGVVGAQGDCEGAMEENAGGKGGCCGGVTAGTSERNGGCIVFYSFTFGSVGAVEIVQ